MYQDLSKSGCRMQQKTRHCSSEGQHESQRTDRRLRGCRFHTWPAKRRRSRYCATCADDSTIFCGGRLFDQYREDAMFREQVDASLSGKRLWYRRTLERSRVPERIVTALDLSHHPFELFLHLSWQTRCATHCPAWPVRFPRNAGDWLGQVHAHIRHQAHRRASRRGTSGVQGIRKALQNPRVPHFHGCLTM
jgi:hypothetical protein